MIEEQMCCNGGKPADAPPWGKAGASTARPALCVCCACSALDSHKTDLPIAASCGCIASVYSSACSNLPEMR